MAAVRYSTYCFLCLSADDSPPPSSRKIFSLYYIVALLREIQTAPHFHIGLGVEFLMIYINNSISRHEVGRSYGDRGLGEAL